MSQPFMGDAFTQRTELNDTQKRQSGADPVVKLYFINYMIVEEEGERKGYVKRGVPVRSQIDGRVYNIPPIGEFLMVKSRVADDLMNRLKIYHPIHGWFEGFTQNEGVARSVKNAFDRGSLKPDPNNNKSILTFQQILEQSNKQGALEDLSLSELEKELKKRKAAEKVEKDSAKT